MEVRVFSTAPEPPAPRRRAPSARRPALLCAAALLASACGAIGPRTGDAGTARLFENRAWVDMDPRAAPGSLRTWASGGTLVMASCTETPRVAAWRWTGTSGIEWEEDGVAIPAEIALIGPEALVLLVTLGGAEETRRYRLAAPGPVC